MQILEVLTTYTIGWLRWAITTTEQRLRTLSLILLKREFWAETGDLDAIDMPKRDRHTFLDWKSICGSILRNNHLVEYNIVSRADSFSILAAAAVQRSVNNAYLYKLFAFPPCCLFLSVLYLALSLQDLGVGDSEIVAICHFFSFLSTSICAVFGCVHFARYWLISAFEFKTLQVCSLDYCFLGALQCGHCIAVVGMSP